MKNNNENENILVKDPEEKETSKLDQNVSIVDQGLQDTAKSTDNTSENNTSVKLESKKDLSLSEVKSEKLINTKPLNKKGIIIASIVSVCIILFLISFSTVFALANMNNNKIISGISIKGIDVSGLTRSRSLRKNN